ncbi:MAG: selenocysteine-specific translation elongation factor [candidate division Zixibacteria bacterium]|nr:selenocysteine-specific translation elongation factor [candidate division Zixibacteria bacterium]MDD5425523.1 selenocysteine-specific translation elongation factor [candidate division Zixibacteria bacterium]
MIVIGTAGHIDHGKSAIVRRLTGTNPDRLPEEQARGMTIDLGFAFYRTPSGENLAFIDVPGHERFVKNMIAGAGGIDCVMLVIAADDGWMPQSQEHFQIVRLLNIKNGLIVINKIDLVEKDWLELLSQEIKQKVAGSFLEEAPVIEVSAQTGEGIDRLYDYLNRLPSLVKARADIGKARLYIDRMFVQPGIGGVVTGTLRDGMFTVGQSVTVWPGGVAGKIRTLHSMNTRVEKTTPSQRTAISFTGLEKEHLRRGGVITDRPDLGFMQRHQVFALTVELLQEAVVELSDRRRVLVLLGTTEVEGEIRLYGKPRLAPSQKGIVFFKPAEPLYALVGDNYIMRLVTPMATLGGGMVIDQLTAFPRRKHFSHFAYLEERLEFSLSRLILSELRKNLLDEADKILEETNLSRKDILSEIQHLTENKKLGRFGNYIYHPDYFQQTITALIDKIEKQLNDNPHLKGLSLEQLMRLSAYSENVTRVVVDYLLSDKRLVRSDDLYDLPGRGMSLKGVIKEAHDKIITALKSHPYAPPSLTELASAGKVYQQAIKYMIDTREAIKCGGDFLFLADIWREIVIFIKDKLNIEGRLMVTELRDRFGFTRKYAIPILEETDRLKLTRREGDFRVKGEMFEDKKFDL